MSFLLQGYVMRHAIAHPDDVAIVLGDRRMTYRELDDLSTGLAHRLIEVGRRGDRVCLLTSKSPEAIVGLVAALKADRVYVPIDVASPATRIEKILAAADPAWVLVDDAGSARCSELEARGALGSVTIGRLEHRRQASGPDPATYPADPPRSDNTDDDPAYIMFTSGSTGDPKGVVITHANVARFVEWAVPYFGIDRTDRNSGHPPLHFDLSVFDIFGTFAAGAQLHLIPAELNLLPDTLLDLIRSSQLTQWFSVPTTLAFLAKHGRMTEPDLSSLRRVLSCGEVLPTTTLIHWMQRVPQASFTNLYGPTETTIASSYFTVPALPVDPTEPVPIGRPCGGEELLVLDEDLHRVPPGAPGDLYIGGVGLSPGYWRDEAKTGSSFIPHPFSSNPDDRLYRTGDLARADAEGTHRFLGRNDSQIKSRGYRIELGEIEAALGSLEVISECAVVAAASDGFEGTTICCAYAVTSGAEVEPRVLRRELSSLLPSYMLPTRWMALDSLPTNVNGKIDRRGLKELFEEEAR